jgi:hypothetical protein
MGFSNLQNFGKEAETEFETETENETEGQGRETAESETGAETETDVEAEDRRTTTAEAEYRRTATAEAEKGTAGTPKARGPQNDGRCPLQHCHRGEDDPRRPLLEHASFLVVSQFLLVQTASRGKAVASSQLQVGGACVTRRRWRRAAHLKGGRSPMGLGRRPQTERPERERPPQNGRRLGSAGEAEPAPWGKARTARPEKGERPE